VSELSEQERRRVEADVAAKVAAEQFGTLVNTMSAIDGPTWPGEDAAELCQLRDGADEGRLVWTIGSRQYAVEASTIVETTIASAGVSIRVRIIGTNGVIAEHAVVHPEAN